MEIWSLAAVGKHYIIQRIPRDLQIGLESSRIGTICICIYYISDLGAHHSREGFWRRRGLCRPVGAKKLLGALLERSEVSRLRSIESPFPFGILADKFNDDDGRISLIYIQHRGIAASQHRSIAADLAETFLRFWRGGSDLSTVIPIFSDLDCAKGTGEGEGCITDPGGLRGKSQSTYGMHVLFPRLIVLTLQTLQDANARTIHLYSPTYNQPNPDPTEEPGFRTIQKLSIQSRERLRPVQDLAGPATAGARPCLGCLLRLRDLGELAPAAPCASQRWIDSGAAAHPFHSWAFGVARLSSG
ncbi:hypothetical protein MBM_02210 [Drepanopeziza brunnea f. sp. 'multigermtubi' MB_m1]|uniref:Uncharacterized protein n=1 Tax=Marssonina brunnea f. sp. multigermtubi (strain MB_m1) TaxID=1072389 RepID=K1XHM2_MARBU|nr:uncharacterized protein MBM_02210 [Drepanopeziza brunnea f. sp. 'multigermtubi' MB_m1]EKD20258.1 hypothetical protein MBM_02210 [Drepanopeziza brunnea f. sp. 'multigermtubi' MB_m1]